MLTNEFEPNPAEHLLAAFRVLDPEGKGYIYKDIMKTLITTQGIPLHKNEIERFLNYAEDKSGEFIFYEDYVNRMIEDMDRHKQNLIKDFENFKVPGAKWDGKCRNL